jgi:cardiolipin synthase
VFAVPPPFDHSKIFIVDDSWCLIGSANWDERSLRLNYEFVVECYHSELPRKLQPYFERRRREARLIGLEEIRSRPFGVKLRDSLARLMTPYL